MERLTYKLKKPTQKGFEYVGINGANAQKVLKKLGELEDLEEQGMLLKLPIPLGKPYFEITKDFGIQTFTLRPAVAGRIIQNNLFGKTVFATLAEAEKALAEMEK